MTEARDRTGDRARDKPRHDDHQHAIDDAREADGAGDVDVFHEDPVVEGRRSGGARATIGRWSGSALAVLRH